MKRFFDNKRYDTEKAKLICEWVSGTPDEPATYAEEHLYRKTTGEYFLCGKGGANTKYAAIRRGLVKGSEEIVPIDIMTARNLVKEHATPEVYNLIFGKEKTGKLVQVNFSMDERYASLLKLLKIKTGRSELDIVTTAILELAEKEGL